MRSKSEYRNHICKAELSLYHGLSSSGTRIPQWCARESLGYVNKFIVESIQKFLTKKDLQVKNRYKQRPQQRIFKEIIKTAQNKQNNCIHQLHKKAFR